MTLRCCALALPRLFTLIGGSACVATPWCMASMPNFWCFLPSSDPRKAVSECTALHAEFTSAKDWQRCFTTLSNCQSAKLLLSCSCQTSNFEKASSGYDYSFDAIPLVFDATDLRLLLPLTAYLGFGILLVLSLAAAVRHKEFVAHEPHVTMWT